MKERMLNTHNCLTYVRKYCLRKCLGLQFLEELALHPNQPIDVSLLRNLFNDQWEADTYAQLAPTFRQANCYELELSEHREFPAMDRKAYSQFKRAVRITGEALTLARLNHDLAKVEQLERDMQFYDRYYHNSFTRHGKPHDLNRQKARDYHAVNQAINQVLDHIKSSLPDVYAFIKAHLHLGYVCVWNEECV